MPSKKDEIIAMAAKYSEGLPGYVDAATLPRYAAPATRSPLDFPVTVLLTGSTGHLGSDILALLLRDERVARVYVLERAGDASGARARLRARWADKAFDKRLLASAKLVVLEGDVTAPSFGQSEAVYEEMRATVSVVIHCAWSTNLSQRLANFEPSVRGARALVDFVRQAGGVDSGNQASGAQPVDEADTVKHTRETVCTARPARGIRLLFASTFSTARDWDGTASTTVGDGTAPLTAVLPTSMPFPAAPGRTPVPEALINDPAVCIGGGGYAQSKYVAERVLASSGIDFTSVRIGQLSGTRAADDDEIRRRGAVKEGTEEQRGEAGTEGRRHGVWALTNWFPMVLRTSLTLGVLPMDDDQVVRWLPMDTAARALVDIAFAATPLAPSHNLVHPRPVSWHQMMESVQRSLARILGKHLPMVPFKQWMVMLYRAASVPDVDVRHDLPGMLFLPRLRDPSTGGVFIQSFAMDRALSVSQALRESEPMNQADMDAWVEYWAEKGLFARQADTAASSRM
ncbi:male sterility protein-domain-containing protein [Schizophyllum commune]